MADNIPAALLSKLAPEMNLNQLQRITNTPNFDQTSQQLSNLSPESLTGLLQQMPTAFGFGNDLTNLPKVPSSKILNGAISSVTNQLNLPTQVQNIVNSFLGGMQIPNFAGGEVNIDSVFESTFSQLAQRSASNFNFSQSQVGNVFQGVQSVSNISSLLNSIQSSVPSNLSPRQLRDLNNSPQAVDNFVELGYSKSVQNIKQQSIQNTQDYVNNAAGSDTTQVKASPVVPNAATDQDFRVKAVVTTYGKGEKIGSGGDKWTANRTSSTGQNNLVEGISCAVDPSKIPYGSKIVFDAPELGTRVAMDTGEAVVAQQAARSRGISLGNEQQLPSPYAPGSSTAKTDQQVRVGGRGSKITGNLTLADADGTVLGTYKFVNGGAGRGSIPFGQYTVSNYMTGQQRARAGRSQQGSLRGANTFDLNDVYDPVYGSNRSGLLIHKATNATEGCIGIQENWEDFEQKMNYLMSKNGGKYKINLGPDAETVNQRNPEQVVTIDVYFESETARKAFEKILQQVSGGGTVGATVQPPRSGTFSRNVTFPSGRTVVAYYPKGYERLKNPSAEQLLKSAGLSPNA